MAGPLLPPSRFFASTFPLANFDFHRGKQASPNNFCLVGCLLLPSHFAQALHTKSALCLTPLPAFPNPPKIHPGMIFQPPRSCLFPPPRKPPPPPSFLFMCSRKPGGWCTTKRWAYLFPFVWESLAFLLSLVWVLVWLAWLIGL